MAEAGPNLPGEAQFEEFEEEEVGAGAEQAEEGAARSAVPEVPHFVEVKVPLAVIYRDMTESDLSTMCTGYRVSCART